MYLLIIYMQQECANKHSPRLGTLIKRDGRVYKRGQQRWGGIFGQKYSFCRNRTAGKSKDPLKGHTVVFITSMGRKKLFIWEGQKFSFQKHNANNDESNDEAGPFTSLQFSYKVWSPQIFVSNTFCICSSSSPKLRLWQGYSSHSIWQCHHPVPSVWIECRGESESPYISNRLLYSIFWWLGNWLHLFFYLEQDTSQMLIPRIPTRKNNLIWFVKSVHTSVSVDLYQTSLTDVWMKMIYVSWSE